MSGRLDQPSVAAQRRPGGLVPRLVRLLREGRLGLAVKGEIGSWISALGEQVGSDRLIFNRLIYSSFHRGALETAPAAVEGLLALYPTLRSAVDLGCGTGVYLNELRRRGLDTVGYEYSAHARNAARRLYAVEARPFDLRDFAGVDRGYDICLCIEVAHYLPPAMGDLLVEHCARAAPRVMFSSAHPGQGGYGHVNAQWRDCWVARFEAQGCRLNEPATARLEAHLRGCLARGLWLADNICLLERNA